MKNKRTRKYYVGCYPADMIPEFKKFPASVVINLDNSDKEGSHWVSIFARSKDHAYYFDSYGLLPENSNILAYLKKFKKITWQKAVIQSIVSNVCGYYVIFFIYMCSLGKSYDEINNILSRKAGVDKYVVNFVRSKIK